MLADRNPSVRTSVYRRLKCPPNGLFTQKVLVECNPPHYVNASGEGMIPDPHGRTMNAYRAAAYQMFEYVDLLTKRLKD